MHREVYAWGQVSVDCWESGRAGQARKVQGALLLLLLWLLLLLSLLWLLLLLLLLLSLLSLLLLSWGGAGEDPIRMMSKTSSVFRPREVRLMRRARINIQHLD